MSFNPIHSREVVWEEVFLEVVEQILWERFLPLPRDREPGFFDNKGEVGGELVEADEGAIGGGAGLFGGGEEFERAFLKVEVGVGAGLPVIFQKVTVEVVAA